MAELNEAASLAPIRVAKTGKMMTTLKGSRWEWAWTCSICGAHGGSSSSEAMARGYGERHYIFTHANGSGPGTRLVPNSDDGPTW